MDYLSWKGLVVITQSNCLTSSGLTKLKHVIKVIIEMCLQY